MSSETHELKTTLLVDELVSAVARSLGVDLLNIDDLRAFTPAITNALSEVLANRASTINRNALTSRLPPEVFCNIARFLPLTSLYNCLFVCRQWRDVLDGDARLWTSLDVQLNDRPGRWAAVLDLLLSRSRRLPVRLLLRVQCSTHASCLQKSLAVVASHMDHIVELAIGLPPAALSRWDALSTVEAPVLDTLRIFCVGYPRSGPGHGPIKFVPEGLFAGHAPRLRTLYIKGAVASPDGVAAFSQVQSVTYDLSPCTAPLSVIISALQHFRAVERVVLLSGVTVRGAVPGNLPTIASVRTLLIADAEASLGTFFLKRCFPSASKSIISYGLQGNTAPPGLLAVLSAHGHGIRRLEVRIRPFSLAEINRSGRPRPFCAVTVNGVLAGVDVSTEAVLDSFVDQRLDSAHLGAVGHLELPLLLARGVLTLAWARLSSLRHLVFSLDSLWTGVLVDRPQEQLPVNPAIRLESVSFVLPAGQRTRGLNVLRRECVMPVTLKANILAIITALAAATTGRIPKLVLAGLPALNHDPVEVSRFVDEVLLEPPVADLPDREPWYWNFPKHSSLNV